MKKCILCEKVVKEIHFIYNHLYSLFNPAYKILYYVHIEVSVFVFLMKLKLEYEKEEKEEKERKFVLN